MIRECLLENRVGSVDRAFDVLESLRRSNSGSTLTELSRKLGIPVSSTHDILYTLVARGYAQKMIGSRRYSLGPRVSDFSVKDTSELELRQICRPYIQQLSQDLLMPATVGLRVGDEGMFVVRTVPSQMKNDELTGRHFELHCTAQGKVLVAWLSETELDRIFRRTAFLRFTPRTIRRLDDLKTHLVDVRKRGFAVTDEEQALGLRGIAVPILNHMGTVIASVAIGGLINTPLVQIEAWAGRLFRVADDISREISG